VDKLVGSCSEASGEDDDELSDDEVALDVGRDEGNLDLDDSDANDLDIGLRLPDPGETDEGTGGQVDLDFSDFFRGEADISQPGDDEAGPDTFDASIGIQKLDREDLSDDALGIEGPELSLDDGGTPWLTPEGDEEGALETFDLFIADESDAIVAPEPWSFETLTQGDFEVVTCLGHAVFAGGSDTWFSGESEPLHVSAVSSAALLGSPERPALLLSTKLGELIRMAPGSTLVPETIAWKAALGLENRSPATLTLCRVGNQQECLALSSTGSLLWVGETEIRKLPLNARPNTLPGTASQATVLASHESGLCLMTSEDGGQHWTTHTLPELVTRVFGEAQVHLAMVDSVLALASRKDGTFVSADGGVRFRPVPGTAASVALVAGEYRGKPRLWAVISHEVRGESDLLMIDPELASAVRLARFPTVDPREGVFAPVTSLDYAPQSESLYAAGAFGLVRLTPATEK